MHWIKSCWASVTKECVTNCFRHTGLVKGRVSDSVLEAQIENELQQQLKKLRIKDPMSINELLHPEGEDEAHEDFTDQDFVDMSTPSEEDEQNGEIQQDETPNIVRNLSRDDRMTALRSVIWMLNESSDDTFHHEKHLRRMLNALRTEKEAGQRERLAQKSLHDFFHLQH